MMMSSKTWNYHTCDILYIIYKDNIFYKNKEIKFVSITSLPFIKDTDIFGYYMELIDAAVNPDHIATFKKLLDKSQLKLFTMKFLSSDS